MTCIRCLPFALLVACGPSTPVVSADPLPGASLLQAQPPPAAPKAGISLAHIEQERPGSEVVDAAPGEPDVLVSAVVGDDIEDGGCGETLQVDVRPGESLYLLADWAGTSVEAIAAINKLDPSASLYPGQRLELPLGGGEDLETQRAGYEASKLDTYLARRGGLVGVESHQVRTGETAWSVARERAGVPLWVLASFNPDADLDSLSIGERLRVPVVADIVAEIDEDEELEPAQLSD